MKDLGPAKQILGMKISHDRKKGKLWLSQESYIEKVLDMFNMGKIGELYTCRSFKVKFKAKSYK
jgi:hypothetical protein